MTRSVAGSGLLALGCLLLLLALALLGRAYLGQWLYNLQAAPPLEEALPARLEPAQARPTLALTPRSSATPVPTAAPDADRPSADRASDAAHVPSAADLGQVAPRPPSAAVVPDSPIEAEPTEAAPAETADADAAPEPNYGEPARLVIPAIGLRARVTPVGIKDGMYEIPWWDVGWQNDSPPLGAPGNTILNGHVETIDAGSVFYYLHGLRPGDLIYAYSAGYRTTWAVESTERLPNDAWEFVQSTDDVRLTLYTCEGAFNWTTRRFSHYRVVVARLVEATEL